MTEENFDDVEAQICAEMTADEEREALKERIAALERENAALREGSDAAGLSALADIREALGVGGKPCLFELAGLVREKVERVRELEAVAVAAEKLASGNYCSCQGGVACEVCAAVERTKLDRALVVAGYLKEAE